MGIDAHKNFAYSTVLTAPSPATTGLSLVVQSGEGTRFPAVPFNATVWPANTIPTPANSEIVRVTAIATDTFTITRAQETGAGGPVARSIVAGDQIAATITAKTLTDVESVEQTTSNTGVQNNFDLTGPNTFLRCTGAAPIFTGFTVAGAAPSAGCRVRIVCLGTSVRVIHQDGSSTAANRIITPSTNGQIVGVNGMMDLVYDDTTDRWRESLIDPGAALDVAYSAGNFTGTGSMTWTVDVGDHSVFNYVQRGKRVRIEISIDTSSVGGTPSTFLMIAVPGGFTTAGVGSATARLFDNNVGAAAVVYWISGQTTIRVQRADNANFSAATNTTFVIATAEFEVA